MTDPSVTVPGDVDRIIGDPHVSPEILVSSWSDDVRTGVATRITGPRSRSQSSERPQG